MHISNFFSPSKIISNPHQLQHEFKLQFPTRPNTLSFSLKQQGNRLVIARKQPIVSPCLSISPPKRSKMGAIQSANVSRELIEIDDDVVAHNNLQFSKDQKNKLKKWHKRTRSNHVNIMEIKEESMSNFSNSLQNISQEVIEIPFAKKIISPFAHQRGQIGLGFRKSGSLDKKGRNSIENRSEVPTKLTFQKKSVEKSRNKQNCHNTVDKKAKADKKLSIPRPKNKQNTLLSLTDFNLKAIKITEGGSIVYLAAHKRTNFIVAIKSIKKKLIKPRLQSFLLQLKLGILLNHPNVAKVFGFFVDCDNFYIVKQYLEEGSIAQKKKKIAEGEISCQINQVLNGVLSIIPRIGCFWELNIKNIAQSHSICKITSIKVNLNETEDNFSQNLKSCLRYLLDSDRRGQNIKDFMETNESIQLNMLKNGSYSLCSFREMLDSILLLTQNEILMLWQAEFLKHYRYRALMLDQK